MIYHKIRGIDKKVCTAEQMIAYNYAFRYRINWKRQFDKLPTEMLRGEFVEMLVRQAAANYMQNYKKFNVDAIACALRAGLQEYIQDDHDKIATSYEEVGKWFPAYYL